MHRLLFSSLVVLIPVTGLLSNKVSADDPAPQKKLTETPTWSLRSTTVAGVKRPVDTKRGERATLSFAKGKVDGDTGCNMLTGSYQAKADGSLVFVEYSITEIGCVHLELEVAFVRVFDLVKKFEVADGVLVLSDGTEKNQLEFVPFQPNHLPLAGTEWKLTHFTESDDVTASATTVLQGGTITMSIKEKQVTGLGGCNRYFGGVTLGEKGSVTFGALASTRRACLAAGVMQQENRFLTTLPKMTKATINENVLTLSNADGTLGLQFTAAKPK